MKNKNKKKKLLNQFILQIISLLKKKKKFKKIIKNLNHILYKKLNPK